MGQGDNGRASDGSLTTPSSGPRSKPARPSECLLGVQLEQKRAEIMSNEHFLSHGGGPWPYVEEPRRQNCLNLERFLIELQPELRCPVRMVLVISGHWDERGFAISASARPGVVFDYYGFPEYLYRIRFAAPDRPKSPPGTRSTKGWGH